jgi:hypothetical protein
MAALGILNLNSVSTLWKYGCAWDAEPKLSSTLWKYGCAWDPEPKLSPFDCVPMFTSSWRVSLFLAVLIVKPNNWAQRALHHFTWEMGIHRSEICMIYSMCLGR